MATPRKTLVERVEDLERQKRRTRGPAGAPGDPGPPGDPGSPGPPGPGASLGFCNTDRVTAPADDTDTILGLSYYPIFGSIIVRQNGVGLLQNTEFTVSGNIVTILASANTIFEDDLFDAGVYAYDTGEDQPGPAITTPTEGEDTTDTTPLITGTAVPGLDVEVFIDGVSIGTVTTLPDGTWSIIAPTQTLATHEVTATQTNSDGSTVDADPVSFIIRAFVPATFTSHGGTRDSGANSGALAGLAAPAGLTIGDMMFVVVTSSVTVTDTRLTNIPGTTVWWGFATTTGAIAATAPGGFGTFWSISCFAFATNAVGVSAVQTVSDNVMVAGDTITLPTVSGWSVVIACEEDGHSITSGTVTTPTGYSTGISASPNKPHTGIHYWDNAGVAGTSPAGVSTFTGGDGGCTYYVIGVVGP